MTTPILTWLGYSLCKDGVPPIQRWGTPPPQVWTDLAGVPPPPPMLTDRQKLLPSRIQRRSRYSLCKASFVTARVRVPGPFPGGRGGEGVPQSGPRTGTPSEPPPPRTAHATGHGQDTPRVLCLLRSRRKTILLKMLKYIKHFNSLGTKKVHGIITACIRRMGKVIVSLCLSVHTRVGVPTLAGGTYLGWGGYLPWWGGYLSWPGGINLGWGDLPWLGGGTHLGWGSIGSTCYVAGSMHLAFTQEDCLVLL